MRDESSDEERNRTRFPFYPVHVTHIPATYALPQYADDEQRHMCPTYPYVYSTHYLSSETDHRMRRGLMQACQYSEQFVPSSRSLHGVSDGRRDGWRPQSSASCSSSLRSVRREGTVAKPGQQSRRRRRRRRSSSSSLSCDRSSSHGGIWQEMQRHSILSPARDNRSLSSLSDWSSLSDRFPEPPPSRTKSSKESPYRSSGNRSRNRSRLRQESSLSSKECASDDFTVLAATNLLVIDDVADGVSMTFRFNAQYKKKKGSDVKIAILGNRPELGDFTAQEIKNMHHDLRDWRAVILHNTNDHILNEGDRRQIPVMELDPEDAGKACTYSTTVKLFPPVERTEIVVYRYVVVKDDDDCEFAHQWTLHDIDRVTRKLKGCWQRVLQAKARRSSHLLDVDDNWIIINENDCRNQGDRLTLEALPKIPSNPYEMSSDDDYE
ncbi:MAG: uncharacterized protein KVP18_003931 [Porospora cf. gigantea A]|uniref:uncharacterized protein n=1 Tax=Porospora cf. gigantea A TaxID=2853593 RepID=UPI00355AAFF5|nr:MAG: hypothetical protein KVP18_003931 [Porospora cf. gigantea A]